MSLPQVPTFDGYRFNDVQLEVSLKPFFDDSASTREAVCREIFEQWRGLWRHARTVSVMLWIAEGSEILEYDGRPETEFEWARYHGAPNRHKGISARSNGGTRNPDHSAIGFNTADLDPDAKGLHSRAFLYRPDPAVFTYAWLAELVADLKRIGGEVTGRPILVGETFDIGPEFATSRFKFDWHREILGDGPLFKEQFISCEAVLKGDDRRYAAFPNGIPEGTRIGTFLGAQLSRLFADCGFDFLWLSNGFGFSLEPWALVGEVFDGARYHSDRAAAIRERILKFWTDLRREFPNRYRIRTRGTNLATGIDIGSDASPLAQIYDGGFDVDAPVNSPWAALDGDFGLELSGWMSHIARHPGDTFRFRFYTHDPWWLNSPWLDRYERQPHDIFLPLSVGRLQADGTLEIPRDLAFLSIDDSNGQMPLSVPNEVTAWILRARETAPDAPGPLLWVYPFDDFHRQGAELGRPDIPLHADAFIGAAISQGVPLNTVVDARDLRAAWTGLPDGRRGAILVSPVPIPGSSAETTLESLLREGAELILYGPLHPESAFAEALGVTRGEPLEGDFTLEPTETAAGTPDLRHLRDAPPLRHTGFLSGGGFTECIAPGAKDASELLVEAVQGRDRRLFMAARTSPGRLVWTRASLTTAEFDPEEPAHIRGPILRPVDPEKLYPPGRALRDALTLLGWTIEPLAGGAPVCMTVHRHRNAFVFSGYHRNERAVLRLRHALGAPLPTGRTSRVAGGVTEVSGEIAWQNEVRVFLIAGDDSEIRVRTLLPAMHGVHRRLLVSGLRNATLRVMVDPEHTETIRILRDPCFPYFVGDFVEPVLEPSSHGPSTVVADADGEIMIEW
jgi:hypothetical protein